MRFVRWYKNSIFFMNTKNQINILPRAKFFDIIFTCDCSTEGCRDEFLLVEVGTQLLESSADCNIIMEFFAGFVEYRDVDLIQSFLQRFIYICHGHCTFLTCISPHKHHLPLLKITRTHLHSNWNALQFPVVVLPTGTVVVSGVSMAPNACRLKLSHQLVTF